jgi:hypothetical protein
MHVQHDWRSGSRVEIEIGFEVTEQRRIFANVRPGVRLSVAARIEALARQEIVLRHLGSGDRSFLPGHTVLVQR